MENDMRNILSQSRLYKILWGKETVVTITEMETAFGEFEELLTASCCGLQNCIYLYRELARVRALIVDCPECRRFPFRFKKKSLAAYL